MNDDLQNMSEQAFEDYGWEKMKALLDRDKPAGAVPPILDGEALGDRAQNPMPARHWLIQTGAILWLAATIYLIFQPKMPLPKLSAQPVVTNESEIKLKGDVLLMPPGAFVTNSKPKKSGNPSVSSAPKSNLTAPQYAHQNAENAVSKKANSLKKQMATKPADGSAHSNEGNQKLVKFDSVVQGFASSAPTEVAQLPILAPQTLAFEAAQPDIATQSSSNILKPTPKLGFRWGVTAGTHTNQFKGFDGWQAGLTSQVRVAPRWALDVGLAFRNTKINGDSSTYLKAESLANSNSSPQASFNLASAKKIVLNQLNYLEMPVQMQFALNDKWRFGMGVKPAFLLSQKTISTSEPGLFVVIGNQGKLSASTVLDVINTRTLQLNRWDFAAIGGVYFSPKKNLELGLRYDLGMNNLLEKLNWHAYNRFLGLNMTYYFK